ncbi:S49 family peptidase [Sphingobium sp. Cam5-1]|uniref:S49 family peptidase n=1 Tax=Sphingobium sp. Cam5-1 TaxID=2789327 RepID=UPI0018AD12ED|nr:S49 family peptidase [Sphingobium sp. Cam5-1]QPI73924.1 S49 family peptidase [Sphingobium sp. Cam5-1]
MIEMASARTLWAMHPDALGDLLKRGTIDAMLPESLRGLAALASGGNKEARAPADPVRDGATMVIPLTGTLTPKGSYGGTSTERFADHVRSAAADTKIGAIILSVMSPGGWVFGTHEAGEAVFEARQSKPVIAVASPYSFSAAHWIACQASAYYVTHSGEVGSVGVRGGHVDMSGFEDKIGMKTTLIASSPEKIAAHPYAPLSDDDRAEIQASIDESNQAFAAAIARGRGIKVSEVEGIHGSGRTFSASRAAAAGAVDGVMSLREVVAKYGSSRARLGLMRQRAEMRSRALSI